MQQVIQLTIVGKNDFYPILLLNHSKSVQRLKNRIFNDKGQTINCDEYLANIVRVLLSLDLSPHEFPYTQFLIVDPCLSFLTSSPS